MLAIINDPPHTKQMMIQQRIPEEEMLMIYHRHPSSLTLLKEKKMNVSGDILSKVSGTTRDF